MSNAIKNQRQILQKLKIETLNEMQLEAQATIHAHSEVVLLSPTGTGKTLAFLLPIIQSLKVDCTEIQVLIVVPSRELAIQIEQVVKEMGTGFKTNAVYGGQTRSKDKINLKHRPAILIGTPGRISDHIRRENFSTEEIHTLILDEFDKSLEVGFEPEMQDILSALDHLQKKVLTSATEGVIIPKFMEISNPKYIKYLSSGTKQLTIKTVISPEKDKLDILFRTICHIGNEPCIVFCNFKDSIRRISSFLGSKNIAHGCFYGGMEQLDRELTLLKFRNGTHQIIVATDLAARGIDIPEIKYIIHYHLPIKAEEFTHRNGRTARMNNHGTAYVLQWEQEQLFEFIGNPLEEILTEQLPPKSSPWQTLMLSGGRRDKISKGDIAGFFFKTGQLQKEEFGIIELKQNCAYVGVLKSVVRPLIGRIDNERLKKKKIRVRVV